MWKKLLIALITLAGTLSLGYAFYNHQMDAAVGSTGGQVIGRINKAPAGISSANIGMKKGDKLLLTDGLGMQLIFLDSGYTDYISGDVKNDQNIFGLSPSLYNAADSTPVSGTPVTAWYSLATSAIATVPATNGQAYPVYTNMGSNYHFLPYGDSNIAAAIAGVSVGRGAALLEPIDLGKIRDVYKSTTNLIGSEPYMSDKLYLKTGEKGKSLTVALQFNGNGFDGLIPTSDLTFSAPYWNQRGFNNYNDGSGFTSTIHNGWNVFDANGQIVHYQDGATTNAAVRPAAFINTSNIVFALSQGTSAGALSSVEEKSLNGYSSLWAATSNWADMKVRLYNSSLLADFKEIENDKKVKIAKVALNGKVQLKVDANAGTGADGNAHTISVLVFQNNAFKYYQPLAVTQSGEQLYEFDTTGIPVGKYKIAVVNETYGNSGEPADSSKISAVQDLEIVATHEIQYTKTPQSGASAGNDYEYAKNVNSGQTIGKITLNPTGVTPITYVIESNGGDNTYQNFEIDGLDANGASSAASLNVKIKSTAPDLDNGGLKAGTYQFCIASTDANGYPDTQINGKTRVCTSLQVNKTKLEIDFDQKTTTKKTITEAATPWNERATGKPTHGTKIIYSITGGDIGLIDIDKDTGEITYKGSGNFGKVTIRATIDDEPDSGNDNYESAYTEKEIVIVREVDGIVTPDAASSDATVPTFSANDVNVKVGGTIGTIKGIEGSPDTIGGSITTYSYAIKSGGDGSLFTVNSSNGEIKSNANLAVGTYNFTITVSDKWSSKDIAVSVNVGVAKAEDLRFYENSSSNTIINTKTVNFTDTNVSVFATVKGSANTNLVTYSLKAGEPTNVIAVNPNSGVVTIKGTGTVVIVATKKGGNGQADAQAELIFTVKAGEQEFIYTDSTLKQELPKNGTKYKAYEEVYAPNKTFNVYTAGNPAGSTVTYQLKAGSPTDVISVDSDGTIHILNASMSTQIGKVIVEATSHDPNGNFADKTIELPITITKATQTVSFAEDPIYAASGKGSVTPVINDQDISSNAGGAVVEDTKTLISVDSSISKTIAKTTDGQTITYNYDKEGGIDIPIHVIKQGNRNYEKAEADGTLHIMDPDESILVVSDVGEVEYGEHFIIESLQDDSASVNVQYTFTVDDTTYITNPDVNGNLAEFDAIKITGSKKVTVTITRTADSEKPLSVKKQITVVPKPIEIVIEDKEKYKGEENPELTYEDFSDQLVEWSGKKDVIQSKDVKLSTTAQTNSPAGDYPIKGDSAYLNKTYPNYVFTFINGTLEVIEENIEDDWYHLETDDGNAYDGGWTNQNVNIVSDHDEYTKLSPDQSTWKANFITISKEGNNEQSFWMKKDSGATTAAKKERIKIDKQAPKVKKITAKDSNNKLQDIINKISGGIFFKPGTTFEINTDDSNAKLEVSGTESIAYKLYKRESDLSYGSPIIEDTLAVTNEKASFTISETAGTYKVCVIPTDKAGNEGIESCHEVTLKKINIDDDGDGKPDFNDPDGDGCPDLNIKWKDDDGQWVVINGDRDNDGIPDLNIDSDGDGTPDLNIDTDNDGRPDLNLVILTKAQWKPTICVNVDEANGILEEYCTGTSVKPQINVDLDDDGIPDINIDNKGDFKPHLNISKDGETPSVNIITLHEWKPNKNYQSGKFSYDSLGNSQNDPQPEINIDSDGDGLPDINIDLDDDGYPDINKDLDGDGIPDIDIDSTGDGIPDVNVDNDGDGKPDENIIEIKHWKPEHNADDPFPYDTMTSFDDPEEPSDVDDPSDPEDPDDPTDPDTDVKGSYNPGIWENMGGALTGDTTNIMLYIGMSSMAVGILLYLAYKRRSEE